MKLPDNFVMTAPHDYAIYLPAVNPEYANVVNTKITSNRPLPVNFDVNDLEFWTGSSKLWNHKFLLHSIGGYKVGTDTRGSLFGKKQNSFCMVGDSGGFQIGKGSLNGLKNLRAGMTGNQAVAEWNDNYDAKIWIIDWLEQYCTYAMTLDMPLWARLAENANSPFHNCTDEQLLAMTLNNLALIGKEKRDRTKWLNVVQGTTPVNTLNWWNSVKHYRLGGWALAGTAGWRGGLYNMLSIILTMRDDAAFESGLDWVHVLGVSQTKWDMFLTAIQKGLRNQNSKLQISCDSATPFSSAGARDEYAIQPVLGPKESDWVVRLESIKATKSYADPTNQIQFPVQSPLGQQLSMHHLVIDDSDFSGRRIDLLTNMLLANSNTWVYLDAGRRANDLAFNGERHNLPPDYAQVLDVIEQTFSTKDWRSVLDANKALLDRVAS
jgi:hypothetical protein